MAVWPDKVRKDMLIVRDRIRETRSSLARSALEKAAAKSGRTPAQVGVEELDKLGKSLRDLAGDLDGDFDRYGVRVAQNVQAISIEVQKLLEGVAESRTRASAGELPRETDEILAHGMKKLDKLFDKVFG